MKMSLMRSATYFLADNPQVFHHCRAPWETQQTPPPARLKNGDELPELVMNAAGRRSNAMVLTDTRLTLPGPLADENRKATLHALHRLQL